MPSKKIMDELSAAAAALNRASDDLNELIENFEDTLQRDGVAVACWLGEGSYEPSACLLAASRRVDPDNENHRVAEGWMLGHDKLDGKWRIAVKRVQIDIYPTASPDDQEHQIDVAKPLPLLKAPREVRLEAASMLEDLASELIRLMKQRVENVHRLKSLEEEEESEQSNEFRPLEWQEKWKNHVTSPAGEPVGRRFAGTPQEYAQQFGWDILATGSDGRVLVLDSKGQQVSIGRSPTDADYLLLVLHKAKSTQLEKAEARRILRASWPNYALHEAYKRGREFVVSIEPILAREGEEQEFDVSEVLEMEAGEQRSLISFEDAIRKLAHQRPPKRPLPF